MIEGKGFFDYFQFLASLNGALLSISIALAALLPTILQLLKEKSNFFEQIDKKGTLKMAMTSLALTAMGFGVSLLICILGLFYPSNLLLFISFICFILSIITLLILTLVITNNTKQLIQ